MDNYNIILFLRCEAIVFEYVLCNFKIFPMPEQKTRRESSLLNNTAPLQINLGPKKSPHSASLDIQDTSSKERIS